MKRKKIVSFLLILTMVLSLVACGNKEEVSSNAGTTDKQTSTESKESSTTEEREDAATENTEDEETESTEDTTVSEVLGLSEKEWKAAIQSNKFENVTFAYKVTSDDVESGSATWKLVENGMLMDDQFITDNETITAAKTMFIDTAIAIVDNFNMFEYDAVNKCYNATGTITYNVNILGYDATITAENVLVEIDANMNIAKIACKMTQDFEDNGTPTTFVLDVEFLFSDYGTTTVE